LIEKKGSGVIKGWVVGEAGSAEMIGTGGKGYAAARATGGAEKRQVGEAIRTEKRRSGCVQPPRTAETERGKQQIFESLQI
jgi:hypothetical protein